VPPFTRGQAAKADIGHADPFEHGHLIAGFAHHFPDLAVQPLL